MSSAKGKIDHGFHKTVEFTARSAELEIAPCSGKCHEADTWLSTSWWNDTEIFRWINDAHRIAERVTARFPDTTRILIAFFQRSIAAKRLAEEVP